MSSDSNVMGMVLVVLVLANLAVSIYVAVKVRSAEEEEDYAVSNPYNAPNSLPKRAPFRPRQ